MSDLRNVLQEEYTKKDRTVTSTSLFEMIEEIMELPLAAIAATDDSVEPLEEAERFSMSIPIPKLNPNESWGDPNSQSRKDVERIFASITRQPSIQARIEHVNSFVDPKFSPKERGLGKDLTQSSI